MKPKAPPECGGGAKAHVEAAKHLAEVASQWPEVRQVSKSLRDLRERNHFREQIEHIFQGGKP